MAGQFAEVDALAAAFQERGGQPALAYGVVAGGELVHARGLGERTLGGPAPDSGTVFRIASMTKSFTAAAVLLLRDEGALALDDPAERYVPELRGLALPAADSPPVTLRHLLTMTAGFPADDPWGDRQQGLPLAQFAGLLAGGVSFAWAPGTRFEYSNLGYAILGRVITAVTGQAYPGFVAQRLLRPLGMSATGYEADGLPADQLAGGYRRGPDGWQELAPDPCGAFAPMGGVFSCVADLARWVSGFAAAFPPGDGRGGGPHPLSAASRREMQLPQAVISPASFTRLPGDPGAGPLGYGFGLFVEDSAESGRIVQHSGGYPGFGTGMRWHPASGTGVIVLANSTYAGAPGLAAQLLGALLRRREPAAGGPVVRGPVVRGPVVRGPVVRGPVVRGPAPAPGGPWPAALAAREEVSQLLQTWDDAAAARLFSQNVALDEPLPERQARIGVIRERLGGFRDDPARAPEFDSPAHCRWWLAGEHAVVAAEILLTPELPPRVQALRLAVPPAPGSPLAQLLETLISLLNEGAPGWPPGLAAAATVDTGVLLRQLRMAAAWAGRCTLGAFRAGNGESTATVELAGEHATMSLAVTVDPASGLLHQADLLLGPPR